jgi:hypothetical protein
LQHIHRQNHLDLLSLCCDNKEKFNLNCSIPFAFVFIFYVTAVDANNNNLLFASTAVIENMKEKYAGILENFSEDLTYNMLHR